jgi:hypothetical protein
MLSSEMIEEHLKYLVSGTNITALVRSVAGEYYGLPSKADDSENAKEVQQPSGGIPTGEAPVGVGASPAVPRSSMAAPLPAGPAHLGDFVADLPMIPAQTTRVSPSGKNPGSRW